MKKTICPGMLVLVFFSISAAWAQTLSAPFDGRRLDADTVAKAGVDAPSKLMAPPRRGVFCGLISDVDSLSICIDGAWMHPDEFRRGAGAKVVWATNMAIKLSTGEVVGVGDVLPKWKLSLKKRAVK